ncbi:siphovirus Gp157 family protein [Yersinia enterocolitica]|uniref:siphovirus Gp157 family protein n=1 Tax=Yersinia enterocolitica TaxID=630 RepID=UPI001C6103A5|nr:siphovirus Gp157 family protein [Yersinia enterocolitica]MBW5853150.1 siphovirus Gp157 family protein [Yersinia enterocolitica]MBX9475121.1 siphovirus Gp157 family protein [Yersinia enterocolitica]HDL7645964.1 siphovirus Gp157 family protein [Yersinia enterocolitica]
MNNVSAISIAADMTKLQELVQFSDDLTPEMIADTMEGLEIELGDKFDAIMSLVRNNEGLAKTCADEAARLNERKKSFENKVRQLKKYILDCLLAAGKDGLKTANNTFTAKKGSISVVIDNESLLPDDLVDTAVITAPNKKAIKQAIEAGIEVSGAHLETGPRILQVR